MRTSFANRDVMVLLGAGASYDLGIPLAIDMAEMVCEMLVRKGAFEISDSRFAAIKRDKKLDASAISFINYFINKELCDNQKIRRLLLMDVEEYSFIHAVHARLSKLRGGRVDIESLGAAIDAAVSLTKADLSVLQDVPDDLQDVQAPLKELARLIRECVRKLVWVSSEDAKKADNLIRVLKFVLSSRSPTIATLNYDNGVELCLDRDGEGHKWGYGFDTGWHDHQPLSFGRRGKLGNVALLKLHGSSNWIVDKDGMVRVISPLALERKLGPQEVIGPPAAILFGGGIKMRYRGPFMALHCEFRRRLGLHGVLLVVGYSFRDAHINDEIGAWARADEARRIIIVDPGVFFDASGNRKSANEILCISDWQVRHIKMPMNQAEGELNGLLGREGY